MYLLAMCHYTQPVYPTMDLPASACVLGGCHFGV